MQEDPVHTLLPAQDSANGMPETDNPVLTTGDVSHFKQRGFIVKRGLIPAEVLRSWLDRLWQTPRGAFLGKTHRPGLIPVSTGLTLRTTMGPSLPMVTALRGTHTISRQTRSGGHIHWVTIRDLSMPLLLTRHCCDWWKSYWVGRCGARRGIAAFIRSFPGRV